MTLAAERAGLPAPGCSAIRRPARKKAGKTHACPPSEAFSNSRRDMPCPVPHASREKHHFRLGYEKSGLDINLLGWWEPVYAGGARIGPRQSALAAAVNASR